MTAVRSFLVWVLCFVVLILLGTPFLIVSFFDNGGVRVYPISVLYMRCVAFLSGLTIQVSGRERVPAGATYVIMANHRSWWDIPAVMIGCWPMQLRFVAKKELADIPLFGICVKRGGHVMIDRKDRDSAIRTMRETARDFAGKFSIVVFPEGTRSPDHRLLPFKRGGFHLARELNIPIVPLSVVGGERLMRKGSINLYPGTMRVMFGAPINPGDYPDVDSLTTEVRRRIGEGLAAMGEFVGDPVGTGGGSRSDGGVVDGGPAVGAVDPVADLPPSGNPAAGSDRPVAG